MAESDAHKTIKYKALEYLGNKGYRVARNEVNAGYYGIYDAWGIQPRTYNTMGIEVKVSRSDWKAAKHKDYRCDLFKQGSESPYGGLCANEIYYACPAGLIQPDEVAEYAGLLWCSEKGRFINKKKPYFMKVSLSKKMATLLNIYEPWYPTY